MKRIGILGDIGSGKSYVSQNFGYPVFNADKVVGNLYKKNKKIFIKLKKILPKFIHSFPISKDEIIKAILVNDINLKKIVKIIHSEVRIEMNKFLKKNRNKRIIILDIPLLLENKINKRGDILIFVKSKKTDILKRLKKRNNFNYKLFNKFRKIQLPLDYKMKKSHFTIKNNFTKKSVKRDISYILSKI
jgi:dephospho-CoA kinase